MSLPLNPDQYARLDWSDREYLNLHTTVLSRPNNLIDLLHQRHAAVARPAITIVGQKRRPHADLTIEVHPQVGDSIIYTAECKSEQNEWGNTAFELLANIKPADLKRDIMATSPGEWAFARRMTHATSPDVFAAVQQIIPNYTGKYGLGLADLGPHHFTSFWRRGTRSTHRVYQTEKLQAAIWHYLTTPEAMLGISDTALLALIPDQMMDAGLFAEAIVTRDDNIAQLVDDGDREIKLAYERTKRKGKGNGQGNEHR